MSTRLARVIAWFYVTVLAYFTVCSPRYRVETPLPHNLEHLAAFAVLGLLFSIGYRSRPLLVPFAGIAYVAALEMLQIWVAGRHARWIDFAMGALGFCIGVGVVQIVSRVRSQVTAS